MPKYIVIRHHPPVQTTGTDFEKYLTNLVITAYEKSFGNVKGDQIGQAAYLPADPVRNRIVQSFTLLPPPPLPPPKVLYPVATAIIEVPSGRAEFMTSDIVLKIERDGRTIIDNRSHYNVLVTADRALPTAAQYQTLAPVSIFVTLPEPGRELGAGDAYVDLPADGTPPSFADLKAAIEKVLAKDPGGMTDISKLTPAQARHIASEIQWNRVMDPPPDPPRSLEELYTKPTTTDVDMDRLLFESKLTAYYAMHSANAEQLAGYVYAVSAAIAGEQISKAAPRVGFHFPVLPTPVDGKYKDAEVILTN